MGVATAGVNTGQISLHPGPVANKDSAILRFTAPADAIYTAYGKFFSGDKGETDAWIVKNGDFTSPLKSLGVTSKNPIFTVSEFLKAGDTLDFVVGNHGNYSYDNTPITVQISSFALPGKVTPPIGVKASGFTGTVSATCQNTTTGKTVSFNKKSNQFLDCKAAGLVVRSGDKVSVNIAANTAPFASHRYELNVEAGGLPVKP